LDDIDPPTIAGEEFDSCAHAMMTSTIEADDDHALAEEARFVSGGM
jgi:hypothetical protein